MLILNIARWPSILILSLAGAVAVFAAFMTVNLFSHTMASLHFLQEHGRTAVQFGALWQVAELFVTGVLALVCWLAFKVCEKELEDRYLTWARHHRDYIDQLRRSIR